MIVILLKFQLENVIYNELLVRGYEVYVGKIKDKEIDFIAKNDEETLYFQGTYLLNSSKTELKKFSV